MARPSVLPPVGEMVAMAESGMTHEQIADKISLDTGHPVAKSSVSSALHRAGKAAHNPRYHRELPWTVSKEHLQEYPLKMLRFLGQRRSGKDMRPGDAKALDDWLGKMADMEAVVAYGRHCGAVYVDVKYQAPADRRDGIPIRRKEITEQELDPNTLLG